MSRHVPPALAVLLVLAWPARAEAIDDLTSIDGLLRAYSDVVSGPAGAAPDRARDEPSPAGAPAASGQRPSPADETAIRDLVRRYAGAREARDAGAIEALFTPDADQLVSSGQWRRGRDVLVTGALASSARTGGTRTLEVEHLRMVGPDVAIADARYEISGLDGGATRRMWSTFVMAREQDGWRITAIRNMLPAQPAR